MENVKRIIDAKPLMEDGRHIEQVVYCCNCKKHDHDGAVGYCNHWRRWTKMCDYCSRGERE